jgi:SAM-dependent methyltransferase
MRLIEQKKINKYFKYAIIVGLLTSILEFFSDSEFYYIYIGFFLILIFVGIGLLLLLKYIYKFKNFGAPFVITKKENIDQIVKFINEKYKDTSESNTASKNKPPKIIDLGSGTGDICIQLAKEGYDVTGIEINSFLVLISKIRAKINDVEKATNFFKGNFWEHDLKKYNCVIVYGISYIMDSLEEKLKSELKPGSIIISNYFEFSNLKPCSNTKEVHCYIV